MLTCPSSIIQSWQHLLEGCGAMKTCYLGCQWVSQHPRCSVSSGILQLSTPGFPQSAHFPAQHWSFLFYCSCWLQLSATSDVVLMVYLYFHPQVLMWFYCGCSCKAPACKFPWEDFLFQALLHYFHAICYVIPEHLPLKCTVTRDCGFDKVGHLCLDQSRKSRLK